MASQFTPSEKAHMKVNPHPISGGGYGPKRFGVLLFKSLIGTPIPYFLILYVISLFTTMSGMEIFGWATAIFTLAYIIIDRFSHSKEFSAFRVGGDFWMWILLVVTWFGLTVNAPEADFWQYYGKMSWVIMLYLVTYCLSLFPGLNKIFYTILIVSTIVAAYSVFQHFTGIDLRYELGIRSKSAVEIAPTAAQSGYQVVGLFGHHLTYGYTFAMALCFPIAALLLSRTRSIPFKVFMILSSLLIGLSLLWTYGRGVWIAVAASLVIMTFFVSRKAMMGLLVIGVLSGGLLYNFNDGFQSRFDTIFDSNMRSNKVRRDLWEANTAMFQDHPWIGIGLGQNEKRTQEYYQKLGIDDKFQGHAHNNYMQWLSTTGLLGFIAYMFFIISFLLITYKLWNDIPRTHYWHRVLVLAALGAQISLHTGGLTQWNFGDAEVNHFFIFILAVMSYMSEKYRSSVVPDDSSL